MLRAVGLGFSRHLFSSVYHAAYPGHTPIGVNPVFSRVFCNVLLNPTVSSELDYITKGANVRV